MQGVFLLYVGAVSFAGGIFARSFSSFGLPEISFLVLLGLVVGVLWRRGSEAPAAHYLLPISVALFLFAIGALRMEWASWSDVHPYFESRLGTQVTLDGVIIREPDERETSTQLYIDTGDETVLVLADMYGTYAYGDVVSTTGILARPEAFETDFGRTFRYPEYLKARGVTYMVRYAEVVQTGNNEGNPFISLLLHGKHAFMHRIEQLLPEPQVGLSEGLLLGVKRALGSELEDVFRETGIIHIVVLSGYNIMLVVTFVTYVLGALLPRRAHVVFGLLAIVSFALVVGLSATVVRASIMASLILIVRATNRIYFVVRALMLAGVIMLLMNPYLLVFDTGFQLSFVATLGLILVAPYVEVRLARLPTVFGIREFLTATLATQVFVTPLLLYQIGQFSVVAVLVNVLVLPVVSVAMLLTFLTGVVSFFSHTLAGFIGLISYATLTYIIAVPTWFAKLPFASFIVPAFPFWVVALSYGVIALVLFRLHRRLGNSVDTSAIDGWVIEEEEVVRMRIAAERSSAATSQDTTPVFFR